MFACRFFEWKKNTVKTPYFIYHTEPFVDEKHYPDINTEKILQILHKDDQDKLPLLAMAGLFDVNHRCEVMTSVLPSNIFSRCYNQ
jgi:hypothetical protein